MILILFIIAFLFLLFTSYCFIPTLYYRFLRKAPCSFNKDENKVMLSFDDGPDPLYTDKLLKILKDNGVCAVFFVVAEKAAQNPEIIKAICGAGHLVGLHSLEHRDAWRSSPSYQKKDFERSLAILENIGCPISFYRAPWGHLNITSLLLARKHKLKVVLWSVMAQDWESESNSRRIVERLLDRTKSGSMICLHDSGCGKGAAPNAQEHTLKAMTDFLPYMLKNGFDFVLPDNCGIEAERRI